MFEKEIKELFELCWAAQQETDAFVHFEIMRFKDYESSTCNVSIRDKGFDRSMKPDGRYYISGTPSLQDDSRTDYIKAKAHLERLLREKGKVSRNENDS